VAAQGRIGKPDAAVRRECLWFLGFRRGRAGVYPGQVIESSQEIMPRQCR